MYTMIVDIMTLSAMCIGLCFSLIPILRFHEKSDGAEGYILVTTIFLPLLYSLLSVSKLTLNSIHLYFLLAILVYVYNGKNLGRLYFLLSSLVIISYLSMLQKSVSIDLIMYALLNGSLTYLTTWIIGFFQVKKVIRGFFSLTSMWLFEMIFGLINPNIGPQTTSGYFIDIISAILVLIAVHYFDRYLDKKQEIINELTWQANSDELTQFYNLYRLHKNFDSEQFNQKMLAIAIIDLDYFKAVNDRYGHNMGNQVLIIFSKHIHQYLAEKISRENFDLYRYGGEEFVVTIRSIGNADMDSLFEGLQSCVNAITINKLNEVLSFSGGIAYFGNHEKDPLMTFEFADKLLYLAKKAGRKQTCIESQ